MDCCTWSGGGNQYTNRTAGNLSDATGFADDSGYQLTHYTAGSPGNATDKLWIFFDMGVQPTGISEIEVRIKKTGVGVWGNNPVVRATNDPAKWALITENGNFTEGTWTNIAAGTTDWVGGAGAVYSWVNVHTAAMASNRYWAFGLQIFGSNGATLEVDTMRMTATGYTGGGAALANLRPLWMDVDSEAGTYLHFTLWADNLLRYWVMDATNLYDTPAFYELSAACTIGELNNSTYVAYPYTPTFEQNLCYIFGRWNDTAEGITHLMLFDFNYAAPSRTRTVIEQGLGVDHIGAFRAEGDTPSLRTFFGIVNSFGGGAAPKLYGGVETFAYISDLTFAAGTWIYVDAMAVNLPKSTVACGGDTAAALMIIEASSPYTTWNDTTLSYPITGGVSSLLYV